MKTDAHFLALPLRFYRIGDPIPTSKPSIAKPLQHHSFPIATPKLKDYSPNNRQVTGAITSVRGSIFISHIYHVIYVTYLFPLLAALFKSHYLAADEHGLSVGTRGEERRRELFRTGQRELRAFKRRVC